MCHAMTFLEKQFLWRWCCGKEQIEMWFIVVCTLTDNEYVSLLVSQTFFSYCFCILKVFEGKVWRVQAVIGIMQRVHFQGLCMGKISGFARVSGLQLQTRLLRPLRPPLFFNLPGSRASLTANHKRWSQICCETSRSFSGNTSNKI